MFVSKIIMEWAPNIHLLGMFVMVFTLVYRTKALIPIYVYVMLNGIFAGFAAWWIPYLYIWTVLWGLTMLLPRRMPIWLALPVYTVLCTLHGLCFGALYAPVQALMYGFNFKQMLAWIASGLYFDVLHAAGNFAASFLIQPLVQLLRKLNKGMRIGEAATTAAPQHLRTE